MPDKSVIFRFYEELNDLLEAEKRKIPFEHAFSGRPAVKDVIESLGVPHTEVDLILVNSEPVSFDYHIKSGDTISVYPVFESLDIHTENKLRPEPLRRLKFILDVHLGKLARYLRMMGLDSYYENDLDDKSIINIAIAEKRVILTRDVQLLKNNLVTHGYYVRNQRPAMQLNEVVRRFDLPRHVNPFTRCLKCNKKIVLISKEDVIHYLLPGTLENFTEFYQCKGCKTIYWEGSHYVRMKNLISKVIEKNR